MSAYICPTCGFNNPPGMRFCGSCGSRLAGVTGSLVQRTPPAVAVPDQIGVMMGADLAERFRQAGLEAAGQRRNVTILFVDLSSFTSLSQEIDDEDTYILIQQYTNMLVKDVYRYEGMVDKIMGDGLMAIFGAPIAHENPSELAIRSALDMQADMRQFSDEMRDRIGHELQLHVGLHTGPVIMGAIGSKLMMNYTAIGDTVNLTSRLEEICPPGAILVSETVYQATRALFDFEPIPAVTLRGFTQPVRAFRVIGERDQPGRVRGIEGLHAALVGRDRELIQLQTIADGLSADRRGRMVLIEGDAGIGKSRLITEFRARMNPKQLRTLVGHSYTYRRSIAYWPFLDLLRHDLDLATTDTEEKLHETLIERVERVLGQKAAEHLPYLEALFSLQVSNSETAERIQYLDAAQFRQQTFLAVREFLIGEAHQTPLVLIFEDLHWADEASIDLLAFLVDAARTEPLLLMVASRPDSETFQKVGDRAQRYLGERFSTLRLLSLSDSQSDELLGQLLLSPDLPENLHNLIVQRAAGNPFYLEEIVRMLIDQGVLIFSKGRWSLDPDADLHALGVPETLQDLIMARFDRLEESQRRILQVASVIGRNFEARILDKVLPTIPTDVLNEELITLVEREFILPEGNLPAPEYQFKHTLVSDTIYNTILKADRGELHELVGEAIEAIYADHIDDQIEILAHHFSLGTRPVRALYYLILAGQRAARTYANEQARVHFETALNLFKKVPHRAEQVYQVHQGLGDVLVFTGEFNSARLHYQSALEALTEAKGSGGTSIKSYPIARSVLHRKIGVAYERQGEYDAALACLEKAENTLGSDHSASAVERAWILLDSGWIYFRRGNLDAAETALKASLDLVENSTHYDVIASIYNRLGGVYFQKDQLDQASVFVRKSLFLRQEIGDVNAVARSYNNLGLLWWKRGDWDAALDNFMHSLQSHASLGDVEGTIELHENLGLLLLDRGEFAKAKTHLDTALTTAQQIGHSHHVAMAYLHFCRLYVTWEKWQEALEYCTLSIKTFQEIGVVENMVDLSTYAGLSYLGLGEAEKAEKSAREAMAIIERTNAGPDAGYDEELGRALRLLGQIAMLKGDYASADQHLISSSEIFLKAGNQIERGRTALITASLKYTVGENAIARHFLNEARSIFRQLGARADIRKVDALALEIEAKENKNEFPRE